MRGQIRRFLLIYHRLLRPHPSERGRDLWFQEEARAERLSNFIRIVYVLAWLMAAALHAPGNRFWANVSNLGCGGIWLLWSIGVQFWLTRHYYKVYYKFITTVVDIIVVTAMIWLCQFAAGPSFALKIPTFLNYFCCLGLASLRFKRGLAVFGGVLAVIFYAIMWAYFQIHYQIIYGTNIEHTMTAKVNWHYLVFQLVYLVVFSFLTYIAAINVRRLVELRARESEETAKARERAMIAASVAHEIKNPLEGIYGAAQLLQEEAKGNPRFVAMILADTRRLNDVVQEFLSFSRQFSVKPVTTDLVDVVKGFCHRQSDIHSGIPLDFSSSVVNRSVYSDPEGICQILLNLVQNAWRYQGNDAVRVRLEAHDDVAEIWIEDDGAGVPEEQRDKLFEPFFTTSTTGTGLGLATSRKIARELGGDLYYEPLNPGSRFVLVVRSYQTSEVVV